MPGAEDFNNVLAEMSAERNPEGRIVDAEAPSPEGLTTTTPETSVSNLAEQQGAERPGQQAQNVPQQAPGQQTPGQPTPQQAMEPGWEHKYFDQPVPFRNEQRRLTNREMVMYAGYGLGHEENNRRLNEERAQFNGQWQAYMEPLRPLVEAMPEGVSWQNVVAEMADLMPLAQELVSNPNLAQYMRDCRDAYDNNFNPPDPTGYGTAQPQARQQAPAQESVPQWAKPLQEYISGQQALEQAREVQRQDQVFVDKLQNVQNTNKHINWAEVNAQGQSRVKEFMFYMKAMAQATQDPSYYDPEFAYHKWRGEADRLHWEMENQRRMADTRQQQVRANQLVPAGPAGNGAQAQGSMKGQTYREKVENLFNQNGSVLGLTNIPAN